MARFGRGYPIKPHLPELNLFTVGLTHYTLAADPATYSISGAAASTLHTYYVTATGTYSLSGAAATATHGYYVTATGTYALSGADAAATRGYYVTATGTYTISGADATFLRTYVATATGSYAITGVAADLLEIEHINADAGSYAISGASATVLHAYVVTATGTYSLSGAATTLIHGITMDAGAGSYTLSGAAAAITPTPTPAALGASSLRRAGGGGDQMSPGWAVISSPLISKPPKRLQLRGEPAKRGQWGLPGFLLLSRVLGGFPEVCGVSEQVGQLGVNRVFSGTPGASGMTQSGIPLERHRPVDPLEDHAELLANLTGLLLEDDDGAVLSQAISGDERLQRMLLTKD